MLVHLNNSMTKWLFSPTWLEEQKYLTQVCILDAHAMEWMTWLHSCTSLLEFEDDLIEIGEIETSMLVLLHLYT